MNGWSVRTVMNGNKLSRTGFALVFLAVMALPSLAKAQEAAGQSLYGVNEILVRQVHFDDVNIARSCRLIGSELDELIMKELQDAKLPVVAEADARPSMMDVARIILVPQIVPFNSQGFDCVTWVAFSAESRNHLRVLPIEIPRIVNVIYWRHGEMIVSAVSVHGDHVDVAIHNMLHEFAVRYTQAQPPKVGRPIAPPPK